MLLSEIMTGLDEIAPLRYAESWDNVGLLVGDRNQQVSKAILTIDYTAEVAAEAQREKCDLIIAYHPPIFEAVKRITSPSVMFDALRRGVAIYSPHTAVDVAPGGTNDMLAEAIGIVDPQPLRMIETKAHSYKLVT